MDGYLNKFKLAAQKAGVQASAFAQQTGRQINTQVQVAQQGFTLPKECERAATILQSFLADPDNPNSALNSIPKAVLQRAQGLAVFSVLKAGFIWSGKAGSGVVVARLPDGSWSAPSCIATGGVGVGFQIGADLSEFVIMMNSQEAVRSFALAGNLTLGGSLSATAGPIGTGGAVQTAVDHPAPIFSYSRSKGLYAGVSLEGVALIERKDANREFYGMDIPARDLLEGRVPAPEAASPMYEVIEAAEQIDESGVPEHAYVPGDPVNNTGGYDLDDGPAPIQTLDHTSHAGRSSGSPDVSASAPSGEGTGSAASASKPIFDASHIN